MIPNLAQIWVYLEREPLAALTITLVAWLAARRVHAWCGYHPLANPVMLAVAALAAGLLATGVDYRQYFQGAQFVHFLLGPATVALAVPLYRQWHAIRRAFPAIAIAVTLGGLAASAIGVSFAVVMGGDRALIASLAPRSVTTPIAMGISEKLGGYPSLTAAVVILSGIAGAVFAPMVLDLARVRDPRARGLAMGTVAHGIGTARALSEGPVTGAFSGLAMGFNALITALLLPMLWRLVFG